MIRDQHMDLDKKRWLVLIASCMINLCIGSLYVWSVFASPMAEYINSIKGTSFDAGSLAVVFTIANLLGPITMISGGKINDSLGPKRVILLGGLMFGGGMFLSGFAKSLGFLLFSYGSLVGLGMGLVYGCTVGNSVKFFPDKRGLVGGIATATYGLSSVLVPPIANKLINSMGVANTFKLLGGIFMLLICTGSFFIEKCPEDYRPRGWSPKAVEGNDGISGDKDWKEMLASPVFYLMILMLSCGAFSGLMCISQASPIAQRMIGMSVLAATTTVSILSLFNTLGRVVAGYISDKIGRINMLTIIFLLLIIGLACLYTSGSGDVLRFHLGISIIGICFGSIMGIFPGFTADKFGSKNNSVNYGIMFIGFALAGFFGPTIMSGLSLKYESYQPAFLVAMGLSIAGLLLTYLYRLMDRRAGGGKNNLAG